MAIVARDVFTHPVGQEGRALHGFTGDYATWHRGSCTHCVLGSGGAGVAHPIVFVHLRPMPSQVKGLLAYCQRHPEACSRMLASSVVDDAPTASLVSCPQEGHRVH